MTFIRSLPALACAAVLTACASTATHTATAPASMASVMADADAAVKAGHADQAYSMLATAAASHPGDKAPLLRIAQMRFDDKQYGEAIVAGQQVLERDPNDMLAYSLVAVSGLRVSSKALGDLSLKNGFTGSVRSEAQELAVLLRSTLNQPIVASPPPARSPVRSSGERAGASARAASSTPAKGSCSGPFCALNP